MKMTTDTLDENAIEAADIQVNQKVEAERPMHRRFSLWMVVSKSRMKSVARPYKEKLHESLLLILVFQSLTSVAR